ncbi:MAG: DUF2235 domain-containing protein [Ruegeria sp.]
MANIVVCCDGTWNSANNKDGRLPAPTNVRKFFADVAEKDDENVAQKTYYRNGVGTSGGVFKRLLGGAIGLGLEDDIKSAYKFLSETYARGDKIFLIGFSRGAYTARSLAGMVCSLGLCDLTNPNLSEKEKWAAVRAALIRYQTEKKDGKVGFMQRHVWLKQTKELQGFDFDQEVPVHFLGVWDTVGSLGIPDDLGLLKALIGDPRKHAFHDTKLSDKVSHARHAVAIDERRVDFTPTLWTDVNSGQAKQVWFPGVHGDVGGSYSDHDLGDLTLEWMMREAKDKGLAFRYGAFVRLTDNPQGQMHDSVTGLFKVRRTRPRSVPSFTAKHDDRSELSAPALARHRRPAQGEVAYWPCRHLQIGESVPLKIRAGERWNRTGLFIEKAGQYRLQAEGEWLDASIKAGPEGAYDGFHVAKGAYLLAALPEAYRGALRGFRQTRNADNSFSRRLSCAPWFALIGVVSSGKGVNTDTKKLDTHQYFEIGRDYDLFAEGDGFLYAFANDAWATYGNNAGHLTLRVERVG